MRVSKDEFDQLCAAYDAAEQAGEFDQLFKGEIHPREGPNKEEFLHSFSTGMKLYKSTFLKIYGYELSYPGYAEKALAWLEMLGCSKARAYYSGVVVEFEHQHEKELKSAAHWYKDQCENEWENMKRKAVRESRKQREVEHLKADLQQKSDRELLILLQMLKQSGA
ncbi:hypothetical protein [uncultured Merdimonas sp.]|uniref:hypothetical protein n=1 Tax=uncultured Merdimonas sp. TaxID=2023269 RepID=UPI00320AA2FC